MRPIKEIAENTITPKPNTVFVPAALWHELLEASYLGLDQRMDEIVAHVITHNTILGNIDAIAANGTWNRAVFASVAAKTHNTNQETQQRKAHTMKIENEQNQAQELEEYINRRAQEEIAFHGESPDDENWIEEAESAIEENLDKFVAKFFPGAVYVNGNYGVECYYKIGGGWILISGDIEDIQVDHTTTDPGW